MTTLEMTEAELLTNVRKLAKLGQWLAYHTHDSRRSEAGFPDLILCHAHTGRVVAAELKSSKGRIRPEQQRWIDALRRGGHEAVIWRPEHWQSGAIQAALLSERKAA